jgi:hypothetical protein
MRRRFAGPMLAIGLFAACGYIKSGSWDDDAGNWKRAFGSAPPADAVVIHSHYSRSPHFTYEFEYFFEIQSHPAFRTELFTRNKLIKAPRSTVTEAKEALGHAPPWFCPKADERYDAWVYEGIPSGQFKVLIDRDTGNIFLTDYQL